MDWLKKHADTAIMLSTMIGGLLWMNGKFNDIDRRLVRIETVLIMKGIMPGDLISKNPEKHNDR